MTGFAAFVEEKFVYDKPEDTFISHNKVQTLLKESVEETGDPILEDFLKRKMTHFIHPSERGLWS